MPYDSQTIGSPESEFLFARAAGTLRVLAAEDNITNQWVLQALLKTVDIEPCIVEDGAALVDMWSQQPWDLILTDIEMPGLDGTEAVRRIRAAESAAGRARTPVLAVTANVLDSQLAEYKRAGIDAVIAKPIDFSTLLGTMKLLLRESEQAEGPQAAPTPLDTEQRVQG